MKNGHCPKCQSTQIYRGTPTAGDGTVHFAAFPGNKLVSIYINAYVCLACGYVEMHVADDDTGKLGAIAQDSKYWQKVG